MSSKIKVSTPEILWHGGGNENGKPDPVYGIDFHPSGLLATAGIDANVPPKGSVRLWKINSQTEEKEYIIEFSDHSSSINTIKFSPCGKLLATASDRQIIVYSVTHSSIWEKLEDMKNVERIWISPNLDEIYDIQWSPDCAYLIAGAINSKAEIIKISNRDTILLPGHTSYVQGVAWDPLNQLVVTLSADRSCKLHMLRTTKVNNTIKVAPKGHVVLRMNSESSKNLFADSTVPCFFRRPTFSPDGALIFLPTGIYRPVSKGDEPSNLSSTSVSTQASDQSFCSYILSRNHLSSPLLCLPGLDEPSVAIRCSPVLYKLMEHGNSSDPMIQGNYRIIFAVITITTIYIYDTQHRCPLARISGCHLATINDVTWSPDGNMLVVCSSDGYLTFIRFPPGSLGEPLSKEEVPDVVKRTLPCHYGYELNLSKSEPLTIIVEDENLDMLNTINSTISSNSTTVLDGISAETSTASVGGGREDRDMDIQESYTTPGKEGNDELDIFAEEELYYLSSGATQTSNYSFDCHVSSPSNSETSVLGIALLNPTDDSSDTLFKKKRRTVPISITTETTDSMKTSFSPERDNLFPSYSPEGECKSDSTRPIVSSSRLETKKEKKRIAPVLLSPFVTASFTRVDSSSSSSSSSITSHHME